MSGAGQGILVANYNNPNAALPNGAAARQMLGVTNSTVMRPEIPRVGGKRSRRRGGYYPLVMGPMARTGVYLIAPAVSNAYKLLSRKRKGKGKKKAKSNRKTRRQ